MSVSGLDTGNFSNINVAYGIGVGVNSDQGIDGQVLLSGGTDQPNRWGAGGGEGHQKLTKGSNISMENTEGEEVDFYDGTEEVEISSADTEANNFSNGKGINLVGDGSSLTPYTFSTNNDNVTIDNLGGDDDNANQVLKVPNTLTITDSAGTSVVYDGHNAESITINDKDTTYTATEPIKITDEVISLDFDTATLEKSDNKLKVVKVPNKLTKGDNITFKNDAEPPEDVDDYDGSGAVTISSTFTDTTYTATEPIKITDEVISLDFDTNTLEKGTSGVTEDKLVVKRVPNALKTGTNITFETITTGIAATTYDGSTGIQISSTDTTYTAGTGINITGTTIKTDNVPNSALDNSTISGISLGGTLATLTFLTKAGSIITSYNGSTPPTSVSLDGDTTYDAVKPITITAPGTLTADFDIGLDYDTNTLEVPEISPNLGKLVVKRVPNSLSITAGGGTTTYDGSTAESITISDGDTTYQGSPTINIDTTGSPPYTISCIKVPNALTAGLGISFSSGSTYDGSSAITISSSEVNKTSQFAWRGDSIDGTSAPRPIQFPKTDTSSWDYYKWYLNGDNPGSSPTGNYVEMNYTMLSGGRYFKLTLDFDFWINSAFQNQNSSLYFKWFKEVGGVSTELDYQPAIVSAWEATIGMSLAVIRVRHSAQSFIYDHGSTLGTDTAITFYPECANLRLTDQPTGATTTSRPIYIMTKNTHTSATGNTGNELTGTITDLGASFTIGT